MAEYSIRQKNRSEYNTSAWSGGTTTEIGIYPETSKYADRDFLWRISSATVDLEESTFTALPDYDRIIMTLEGDIDLCHNGGEWIHLNAFETHSFDGGDDTVSKGKVVDFNLMLRKGKAGGMLVPLTFLEDGTCSNDCEFLSAETRCEEAHYKYEEVMIYCHRGPVWITLSDGQERTLEAGESLWVYGGLSGMQCEIHGGADARAVFAAMYEK